MPSALSDRAVGRACTHVGSDAWLQSFPVCAERRGEERGLDLRLLQLSKDLPPRLPSPSQPDCSRLGPREAAGSSLKEPQQTTVYPTKKMWLGEGWVAHPHRPRGLLSYQLIARGSAATFRVTGHRQRELHFPAQSPGQQAQSRPFLRRAAGSVMSWRCLAQTDKHPVVWKAEVLLNVPAAASLLRAQRGPSCP